MSCSDRDCGSLQYKTVLARRGIHSCSDFLEKSQNCYSHYSDSLETYSQKDAKMRQMDTPVTACNGIPVFVFIMCGGFHIYHNVCFWCVDDNKGFR